MGLQHDKIVTYIKHKLDQTMKNQRLLEKGKEQKNNNGIRTIKTRRVKYISKHDRKAALKELKRKIEEHSSGVRESNTDGGSGDGLFDSGIGFSMWDVGGDLQSAKGVDQQSHQEGDGVVEDNIEHGKE